MKVTQFLLIVLIVQSQYVFALGRLFMTPEQRIQLEHKNPIIKSEDKSKPLKQDQRAPQAIYVNGFVKPKHAASTIWINGHVRPSRPQKNHFVRHWVSPDNQVSVDLRGRRAELSPGQTLDIDNRIITEVYHTNTQKKEEIEQETAEVEKQDNIEENKKTSVIQKAIKLNKIMTSTPPHL